MKHSAIGPCVELTLHQDIEYLAGLPWVKIRRLELAIDDAGLRVKVNDGVWTPPFGTLTAKDLTTRPREADADV